MLGTVMFFISSCLIETENLSSAASATFRRWEMEANLSYSIWTNLAQATLHIIGYRMMQHCFLNLNPLLQGAKREWGGGAVVQ